MKKSVCQKLIKKKSSQIIGEAFVYTGTRDMIKSINAEEMMRKQLKTLYRNNTNECVIEAMKFEDEEKKKLMLQRKKEYYWAHKEEINKRQKEYYKKRKEFA